MKQLFNKLNITKTGYLDAKDIEHALCCPEDCDNYCNINIQKCKPETVQRLLDTVGKDGHKITYEDFK